MRKDMRRSANFDVYAGDMSVVRSNKFRCASTVALSKASNKSIG